MNHRPVLIPLKEVLARVPLSKSELYRRIKAGTFPAQVHLGPTRIAFVEAEVNEWIMHHVMSRPEGRRR